MEFLIVNSLKMIYEVVDTSNLVDVSLTILQGPEEVTNIFSLHCLQLETLYALNLLV